MKKLIILMLTAIFLGIIITTYAQAQSILAYSSYPGNNLKYGGSDWTVMTNIMNIATGNNVTQTTVLDDFNLINMYDALWIDLGAIGSALTTTQQSNITSFLDSGKKTVFIGEWSYWHTWNNSFVSLLGATPNSNNTVNGLKNTHPSAAGLGLLDGVNSVYVAAGGSMYNQGSGLSLFTASVVTLYNDQALVILDSGIFSRFAFDSMPGDNVQFAQNVAAWAADSSGRGTVPEPSAMILFGFGLVGLAGISRKRLSK